MTLDRDAILEVNDVRKEVVNVPEWGGQINVRGLTSRQRDSFERNHLDGKLKDYRATVASQAICDDEGKQIFQSSDILKLGEKSSSALSLVFDVAMKLSGITEKDVDVIEGN